MASKLDNEKFIRDGIIFFFCMKYYIHFIVCQLLGKTYIKALSKYWEKKEKKHDIITIFNGLQLTPYSLSTILRDKNVGDCHKDYKMGTKK